MKNRLTCAAYTLLFIFFISSAFAQTGVKISASPGTADPSAMLDIESASRGLLVPRVNLVSLTNGSSPIAGPATGLLVYNLGGGGVPAVGFYYWTGTAWVQLTAGGFSGAGTVNYVTKWTATNALGTSQLFDNGTNVGIGNTSPGEKLDVSGNIKATGLVYWGNGAVRTETRDNAGLRGDAGARSGFFETSSPSPASNWPTGTSSWWHLLDIRHSNNGNNYAMQFAGSFFDQNLYFRKTNDNAAQPWSRIVTEGTNTVVYGYTGGDQSFSVPSGVTTITVKLWGAGGGSGYWGGWDGGFSGGGGGFTTGKIAVSPGQVYTIIVGGAGSTAFQYNTTTSNSYGGGSRGCNTGSDCRYGGGGGGRSAIRLGGTELMTAGGGGGGGSSRDWTYYRCEGGAGGGLVGQDGVAVQNPAYRATGGTQSGGGGGGLNAQAGSQFTGGNPASNGYGGGGGGGWYGGGGGSYQESNLMGGGGGGSGYIGGANVSNAYTIGGWNSQPGGDSDVNYAAGIGVGGITQYHSIGTPAGNGRVVIIY